MEDDGPTPLYLYANVCDACRRTMLEGVKARSSYDAIHSLTSMTRSELQPKVFPATGIAGCLHNGMLNYALTNLPPAWCSGAVGAMAADRGRAGWL